MDTMDIYAALEKHSAKMERIKGLFQMVNDLVWDRITSGEDESEEIHKIGFLTETVVESIALREKEFDSIMKAVRDKNKSPLA